MANSNLIQYDFSSKVFNDLEKIERIRNEIGKYLTKIKQENKHISSYGLKHILEEHIDEYVSNEELIYSMHLEGFQMFGQGINRNFNVGKKGINLLINSKTIKKTLKKPLNHKCSEYLIKNKRFLKNKYNISLIINLKFWQQIHLKTYIPEIIAIEISEDKQVVKGWMNLLKFEATVIPEDKLELISKVLNIDKKELINI